MLILSVSTLSHHRGNDKGSNIFNNDEITICRKISCLYETEFFLYLFFYLNKMLALVGILIKFVDDSDLD